MVRVHSLGFKLAVSLLGSVSLTSVAANAQEASPSAEQSAFGVEAIRQDDGAIVVTAPRFVPSGAITASKTTAPLIETPQSVSVISRDQIDLLNFTDVQEAVRYTSGIVGENYGPDMRFDFLTLRGFIPVQYIDGLQAPVSATINNVGVDLYGAEAVDILKGPAGFLYGTTPPGGIYNLTSRRPSAQLGGELQVKYGTHDLKQVAGTVTGALTDGVSARLTGLYRDRDGQTDFVTAKRAYIAPAVTVDIGANTKITALGRYQWDRINGDTNGFLPAIGVLYPNPVGKVPRDINLGEPDYNYYRRVQWGVGYELSHRFSPSLRFVQNARWDDYAEYQQIIYATGLAADNRTVFRANYPYKDDVNQFAIDNRFEGTFNTGAISHRVLVGLDYRNYREASAYAFDFNVPTIDLFDPVYSSTPIDVPDLNTPFTNQRLKQTGLYLQDQARIGNFILTLSGRQDWMHVTNYNLATPAKNKQDKFTWRVGGTYVSENGLAPYISYATSFQPVIGQTKEGDAFSPTSGKQWEIGVKYDARALENVKLFATAALFRIEQSNVLTTDPENTLFQIQAGEVVSKGLELEAVARIRDRLSINASYTYTDAKISKSNLQDANGNYIERGARLSAQPRHKASLFVDYTSPMGLGGGAGVRHLSSSAGNAPSIWTPLVYTSPATTLFDATLHYDIPGWRFAINGSNLFDKRYAGRCSGPSSCFFGQERQITGTITKRF